MLQIIPIVSSLIGIDCTDFMIRRRGKIVKKENSILKKQQTANNSQ